MQEYQVVQTQGDVVELRVVPNDDFSEASRQALPAALPGVTVHIRTMPSIPFEPSGKYRIVQSRGARSGRDSAVSRRAPRMEPGVSAT